MICCYFFFGKWICRVFYFFWLFFKNKFLLYYMYVKRNIVVNYMIWNKCLLCVNFFFILVVFLLMGMIVWFVYVIDFWVVFYLFGFSIIVFVLVVILGILFILDVDENNFYRICVDCIIFGLFDWIKMWLVFLDMSIGRFLFWNDWIILLNFWFEYD